ncbi:Atg14 domain-containing protein [Candidatus Dojkabacteria bacterium]|jgi:chromosome segregation ATPase|nr:Atg14 domain-containing protein [Candidatus Dojkabacteria bacterium]
MYPRTITIENDELKALITKKGELVNKGRAVSEKIENVEKKMEEVDKKVQEEEAKVDISDLNEKQKAIGAKVDEAIKEMEAIRKEIFDRMIKQVPDGLHKQYEDLHKEKEKLEEERNKIALKAQKYNDKIIPTGRELMKPFLKDMYEDYDSLYIEDGEIVATIFSHLHDFKVNFKKK